MQNNNIATTTLGPLARPKIFAEMMSDLAKSYQLHTFYWSSSGSIGWMASTSGVLDLRVELEVSVEE